MSSLDTPPSDNRHATARKVGIRGGRISAEVTPWGDVLPADGSPSLEWHVADEDRWHSPRNEASIRQTWREGTPVVETRLRVRGGDVVQRIYAVADSGGLVVLEFENDSPTSVAVALTRNDVVTQRPPTTQPVMGIDLPSDTIVLPIGHRATIRVALPLGGTTTSGASLGSLPSPEAVVRGWLQAVETSARFVANDEPVQQLARAVVEARCALLLGGIVDPHDDPMGTLLDGIELVRMGEKPEIWLDELVPLAESCFSRHRSYASQDLAQAAAGVQDLLTRAGEKRGARDVAAMWKKISTGDTGDTGNTIAASFTHGRRVAAIEQQLLSVRPDGSVVLMPNGVPNEWRGCNIESYGLMGGGGAFVSFALRWHGANVAALWEISNGDLALTSGVDHTWSNSGVATGEALWQLS
jgi:hypothetical protein